jgi:uncharacterized damage-inducible protein DinB
MDDAVVRALFDHLYWVNRRLLAAAARLSTEEFTSPTTPETPIVVTTRDLRATLVHELDVEWSWRLNLQGKPIDEWGPDEELKPEDYPDVRTLRERWARDEAEMRAWLEGLSDKDLARLTSSAFTNDQRPLWHYLLHITTHAAQQQADAATLLTLKGASPDELDFLAYLKVTEEG